MESIHLQLIFLSSLALSLALTPLFAALARRWGVVDDPGHRKIHEKSVPYFGGVAIITTLVLLTIAMMYFRPQIIAIISWPGYAKGLFIVGGTLGVGLVGAWDDFRTIRARYKLLGQMLFVWAFAEFGFRFEVFHIPGLPPVYLSYFAVPVTMFWMLAVVNAFNLVDGVDGLAGSIAAGSLVTLAAAAAALGNPVAMAMAVCALGAVIGFLFFNWKPAKVYLGDAGSSGLGMFMACSILSLGRTYGVDYYKPHQEHLLGQPYVYQIVIATLIVAYPALEITLSVFRRLLHGRPISRADRGHIHHRLIKAGFDSRGVAIIALLINILPGLAVFSIINHQKGMATWFLMVFAIIVGVGMSVLGFFDFLKPKVMERLRPHFQIVHHFIEMQRAKLSLAESRLEVLALVEQTCQEFGVHTYRMVLLPDRDAKGGFDYTNKPRNQLSLPTMLKFLHANQKQVDKHHDQVKLPNGKGGAFWVFEHHDSEEEIDTEYRVLLSEFMRESLKKIVILGDSKGTLELKEAFPPANRAMSGHSLRKRRTE